MKRSFIALFFLVASVSAYAGGHKDHKNEAKAELIPEPAGKKILHEPDSPGDSTKSSLFPFIKTIRNNFSKPDTLEEQDDWFFRTLEFGGSPYL